MDGYTILVIVVLTTALAAWANDRFLRLPSAIGVMVGGLLVAGGFLLSNLLGWINDDEAIQMVKSLHLDELLIGGQGKDSAGEGILLGILLFASAMRIEPSSMTRRMGFIAWLATVGVVLTAAITAGCLMGLFSLANIPSQFMHMLLFGAILAPTDPVAAISLLRRTSAPVRVREVVAGESLFNDGVSIVLVLFLIAYITGDSPLPFGEHWWVAFAVEAGGAIAVGLVVGVVARYLIQTCSRSANVVLLTLATVLAIGILAPRLYMSTPVMAVVAGLVVGRAPHLRQQDKEGMVVVGFWGVVESALTAMLFLLIGLEVLAVELQWGPVLWSFAVIPLLLLSRFIALLIPWSIAKGLHRTSMSLDELALMTWCGLRGGVSIALALALPLTITVWDGTGTLRSKVMVSTIVVVIGSILIQGLTVERMARMVQRRSDRRAARKAAAA